MKITAVRQQPSGLYLVFDDQRRIYATKNAWLASKADQARLQGKEVAILDGRGWFYRNLLAIRIIEQKETFA